jgi:nitroimidazol reductase NimA-like FMN-containing flavoprotein (pyridoxamine 5'-phosphate oxidase superfamily)
MLVDMKQLVREKNICVLATLGGNKPYCSLMAYAPNSDGSEVYMATRRSSRKFKNLSENPAVSLLIDTREDAARSQIRALTVEGTCARIEDETQKQLAAALLLSVHPHLESFLAHVDIEILCVTIRSFLLLKGLDDAHHAVLE